MLRPGHRVDILGTFSRDGRRGDRITATLLQNVLLLATGQDLGKGQEPGKETEGQGRFGTVTLSVGLEEAQLLSLAATQGILSLVLRGYQDLTVLRDVPEKEMADVWEADRRNALNARSADQAVPIERLQPR